MVATDLDSLLERHEAQRLAFLRLTETEQARTQFANFTRYAKDPWAFLTDCVWTRDQVDSVHPIKPYPNYLEYLKFFVRLWQQHLLVAVPKSRRMTMSWTCIPLFLHDTIFRQGRDQAVVSKKQDDAGELIERAEFVFRHIPEWRIPAVLLPKIRNGRMTKEPPALVFEEIHSKLTGFPMGADQLRQFTFSGVFGDECAFWEEAEDFYSATKPTLDGGGRMTLVSSRAPGFFKKIVFDCIDHPDYNFPETPPTPVRVPMPGVEYWVNPKNRFAVCDLHYTANPAKRGREWAAGVRSSMPIRKFMREYEKSWQSFEGLPVYGDFERGFHVASELDYEPTMPLLLGWDFGLTPACVVTQLIDGNLRVLREYIGTNESIKTFAPKVASDLRIRFGSTALSASKRIINYPDPAGFDRGQTDERTCVSYLTANGFAEVLRVSNVFTERIHAVESYLLRRSRGGPGLLIDARHCPMLIEGFAGGYQYPPKAIDIEPSKVRPLKNSWSHIHDAFQYVAQGASTLIRSQTVTIPTPSYGFQRETPSVVSPAKGKLSYG